MVVRLAFTGQGYPVADVANDDSQTRIKWMEEER